MKTQVVPQNHLGNEAQCCPISRANAPQSCSKLRCVVAKQPPPKDAFSRKVQIVFWPDCDEVLMSEIEAEAGRAPRLRLLRSALELRAARRGRAKIERRL